ncbi:MAG: 50S ribosomal protein L10 [Patescibacteria group bacterium]|nr:50S ribosomal protein L10 [Patescibacteria group bacterium]
MKTKLQKSEELKEARQLLDKAQALIFADFTKISAEDIRRFRRELKKVDANFLVIKKRLLGILLKEKGINADLKQFKVSVGTIFAGDDIEKVAGPAYQFFSKLEVPEGGDKQMWVKHLLAGHDIKRSNPLDAAQVVFIGKLPPREVMLAQLLSILVAPLRSFMYLLDQKSKVAKG